MKIVLKKIIFSFTIINTLLNKVLYIYILIDSECLYFNIMSKSDTIDEIVKIYINIDRYIKLHYFYIKSNNLKYDLILSRL